MFKALEVRAQDTRVVRIALRDFGERMASLYRALESRPGELP